MRQRFKVKYGPAAFLFSLSGVGVAFLLGVVGVAYIANVPPPGVSQLSISPDAIHGKAAIVYDPTTGEILFNKNAQVRMPLASLTKLMTAQAALAILATSTTVMITPQDLKPEGDWGFRPGDVVSLHDLIAFALVASSNDAIEAAANVLGSNSIGQINSAAADYGLNSYVLNPTGLDQTGDTAGGYGSAYDVAKLASGFYKTYPEYFELTERPNISIQSGGRTLTAAATMAPIQDIPGFVGAKTGYTDLAGGNLVAVFDLDIGHPVVAVVLGSTQQGRFDDVRLMINAVRSR